jgi:gluconate 2-dehydrogenase gamma chain
MDFSRRDLLVGSLSFATLAEISDAQEHAHGIVSSNAKPSLAYLDGETAKEIEALTSCIVPSDETPGAREAGVVYFIDRALTTFDQSRRDLYRAGLADLQARRTKKFPSSKSIAELPAAEQTELLKSIEGSEFFQLLRTHTLYGFLGDPSYGGNRNGAGWKAVGFDAKMQHQPPFGFYDAEIKRGAK